MQMIRAFIAIDLPEAVKNALVGVCDQLERQLPRGSVRWVRPERMHVTLRFLGDTAVSQLSHIAAGLDSVAKQHHAFSVQLSHLGCFPNARRPRVIWVGLQGQTAALVSLKQGIDQMLAPLGWEVETRPFQAHLTIGRVKDARLLAGLEWGVDVEKLEVVVTAVKLIESQLRPSGPIYTVRHQANLLQTG